jgi:hypothetical protein
MFFFCFALDLMFLLSFCMFEKTSFLCSDEKDVLSVRVCDINDGCQQYYYKRQLFNAFVQVRSG